MSSLPYILDPEYGQVRPHDVYSLLLERREIWIVGDIHDSVANYWAAAMQYLAHKDPKADIKLVINSPGGSITAGMAMYDTMQSIPCDIETVVLGQAASFGAVLLCAGTKGKRFAAPNARVLIHQPLGGVRGEATDIALQAEEILRIKTMLTKLIAHHTGQDYDRVDRDCDRDTILNAKECVDYGLVDSISGDGPSFV